MSCRFSPRLLPAHMLALIVVIACGCLPTPFSPECPDLATVPWESVSVSFCVGDVSPVAREILTVREPSVLKELQAAFEATRPVDMWGIVTHRYNCLDVSLSDGRTWRLHFFDPREATVLDVASADTSFGFKVDPRFFRKVEELVSSSTTGSVHFFYDSPVSVVEVEEE